MASLFATQQRWLLAHAAVAQYFRNEADEAGSGLLAERFLEIVERHSLASRNTASAFLKELLKYEIVRYVANSEGRRHRPLEPAPAVLMALFHWHALHLATLDGLDGGARVAAFHARPALLGVIQPLIADGLIASADVRYPPRTFDLFTWIDEGGLVMDRLIVGCEEGAERPRANSNRRDLGFRTGAAAQPVADPARPQVCRGGGAGQPGLVWRAGEVAAVGVGGLSLRISFSPGREALDHRRRL